MEKTIKLSGKEFKLHASIFTIIEYKNVFGTELFNDIKKIDVNSTNIENNFSSIIDSVLRITYILHRPFTNLSYDKFLMELDFSTLTNVADIEKLANVIAEMLGSVKKSNTPQ
jgi:hypothetical protein